MHTQMRNGCTTSAEAIRSSQGPIGCPDGDDDATLRAPTLRSEMASQVIGCS